MDGGKRQELTTKKQRLQEIEAKEIVTRVILRMRYQRRE